MMGTQMQMQGTGITQFQGPVSQQQPQQQPPRYM